MFTLIQCGFRTSAKVSLLTAVAVSLAKELPAKTEMDQEALAAPVSEETKFGELVARSLPMRELFATLERVAPAPSEQRIFRPPHGRYTLATIRSAQAAGFEGPLGEAARDIFARAVDRAGNRQRRHFGRDRSTGYRRSTEHR